MKNIVKTIRLSCKYLSYCSAARIWMLAGGVVEFALLGIYGNLISPAVISLLYGALEEGTASAVYARCGICAGIVLMFCLFSYLNDVYVDLNCFKIQEEVFARVCAKLYNVPLDSGKKNMEHSQLQARMDGGSGSADSVFIFMFIILGNIVSAVLLLLMAGSVSWFLVILALLSLLAGALMTRYNTNKVKQYEPQRQEAEAQSNACMDVAARQVRVVLINGVEDIIYTRYKETRREEWNVKWKMERASFLSNGITGAFTGMLKGVLGWRMQVDYDEGRLSNSSVASSFSVYDRMRELAKGFQFPFGNIQSSLVQLERLDEVIVEMQAVPAGPAPQEPAVSMCSAVYRAGEKTLVDHVTGQVQVGEKVALVGKNGSGKTTLLRMLCGLYSPAEGEVKLNGVAAEGMDVAARRLVWSYIPAAPMLYEGTVDDNVLMNADEEEIIGREEAESRAEIQDLGQEKISELSGGQKQRANIARGCVHKVPLLLADEPAAGLSLAQGTRILSKLLSEYGTCIVTTHQKEHISLFTRVIVMQDGKVQADLPVEEFLRSKWFAEW